MNQGSKTRILIIDDNINIHQDFIKILSASPSQSKLNNFEEIFNLNDQKEKNPFGEFDIDTASQGQEGFEKVKRALEENKPYALAFVDSRMPPGWDGVMTIQQIWKVDPNIQCVICTAYSDYSWEQITHELKNSSNFLILKKPFDLIEVRQLAAALAQKWHLQKQVQSQIENLEDTVTVRTAKLVKSEENLSQSETMFSEFAEKINDVFWRINPSLDKIIYVSPAYEKIWGLSIADLYKNPQEWFNVIHPDDKERVANIFLKDIKSHPSVTVEYRIIRPDGAIRFIYSKGFPLNDKEGKLVSLLGVSSDITSYKQEQQSNLIILDVKKLIKNGSSLKTTSFKILKTICLALDWDYGEIWLKDSAKKDLHNLNYWSNPEFENLAFNQISSEITFKPGMSLPGKVLQDATPIWIEDIQKFADLIRSDEAANADLNSAVGVPIIYQGEKLGVIDFFSQKILKPDDILLNMMAMVATMFGEFIKQKYSEIEIVHAANHDHLTGFLNRFSFDKKLNASINTKAHSALSVYILGVDQFRNVLSPIGYDAADELILGIADRLRQLDLENSANIARLTPDKFALYLPCVNSMTEILTEAKKILRAFKAPFLINNEDVYITPCIGIALYPQDGKDSKTLLRNADTALNLTKQPYQNHIQFCTNELPQSVSEKLMMEVALRHALANKNEFCLYYQPQVDLQTGKVIGMESLIRWQHPTLGLLSPAHFIPLAEEIGLIIEIDQWVLEEVFKQIQSGWPTVNIAVNISAKHFTKHFELLSFIKTLLTHYNVKANQVEIEVTESQLLDETLDSHEILTELQALGFTLALDDFGTGFSSLRYLLSMPVHKIKIDKSFVDNIPNDTKSIAIVKTLIVLAHALGKKVIAEGVETAEQLQFLIQEHCDEIQGYYFSKPLSLVEIQPMLSHRWDLIKDSK